MPEEIVSLKKKKNSYFPQYLTVLVTNSDTACYLPNFNPPKGFPPS